MSTPVVWHPEHDAMLKENFVAGMSYSNSAARINREFGTKFSRCAAIGRSSRLGMRTPKKEAKPKQPKIFRPKKTPPEHSEIVLKAKRKRLHGVYEPFVARTVDINPENVTLLELDPCGCRWPSGEGPYLFCNHPKIGELPYCLGHARLAYREDQSRA